jgi:hypothetical protein
MMVSGSAPGGFRVASGWFPGGSGWFPWIRLGVGFGSDGYLLLVSGSAPGGSGIRPGWVTSDGSLPGPPVTELDSSF